MSLQDILLQRAAIEHPEFRSDFGKGDPSTLFSDIASGVLKGIQAEQERVAKQKESALQQKQRIENFNKIIDMTKTSNDLKTRVKLSIDKEGNPSAQIIPVDEEELKYKQESIRIRNENLLQKKAEEQRRILTAKLNNAKSFGAIIPKQQVESISSELGYDLGTDLQSGRIEPTKSGDFRFLSNEEFKQKQEVLDSARENEKMLSGIEKDVAQIYRMFDEIDPSLKGPVEGRIKAPLAAVAGDTNLVTFNEMVGQFLGPVARGLAMEKGVLTQPDIDRIRGNLPKVTDTDEIKAKKLSEIKNILSNRRSVISESTNFRLINKNNKTTDVENFEDVKMPTDRKSMLYKKYKLE